MNSIFGCTWFDENWNGGSNGASYNYGLLADQSNLVISQPADAVTFVENHDTGSTQNHWALNTNAVGTAYAFILTHPGYPCVAWQHYFTYAESGSYDSEYYSKIKASTTYIASNKVPGTDKTYRQHIDYLIDLRKDVGIEYDDKVSTSGTSSSCYVGEIIGNNGSLLVMIGNVTTPTREEYKGKQPIYSGTNFAIYRGNATELPEDDNSGESFTLKFTNKDGWGEPYAYYFGDYGTVGPDWPGTKMTFVETNKFGQNVYSTVTQSDATHVIFTDGNNQTVNILLDSSVEGYYTDGGTTKNNEGKTIYTVKKWGE